MVTSDFLFKGLPRVSLFLILSLLLLSLMPSAGLSATAGAGGKVRATDEREVASAKEKLLQRIREAAAGVETVASTMVQEKYLKAFSEVLESRGNFAFQRPDCWRWELTQPLLSGISVCAQSGKRWHEKGGARQSFKLADEPWLRHFATQVTAWTTADFEFLQKEYLLTLLSSEPSSALPTLKLIPREAAARRLIDSLEITFSVDCRYVTRIIIRETDGDYTAIKFLDVVINQPLPEGIF